MAHGRGRLVAHGRGRLVAHGRGRLVAHGRGRLVAHGRGLVAHCGRGRQVAYYSRGKINYRVGFAKPIRDGTELTTEYQVALKRWRVKHRELQCG